MKPNRLLSKGLLALTCVALPFVAAQAAQKCLNLLLITADDLNGDSMGWMGSKVGATPNIDSFAATAHQFRNCHVSAPICQPSRSAFMTGRVPHRNGALGFHPINLDVPTMTEVMSSNGFFTAAINKTGHMMPRSKFNWDLILEGSGKNPKMLREHFEQCLKAAADAGKPFFINANSTDPHRPFIGSAKAEGDEKAPRGPRAAKNQAAAAPAKMYSESEVVVPSFLEDLPDVRKEIAQYFSSVRRLDETFGELIAALRAAGHLADTVIVFLGDHGMSFPYSKATLYRNGTWTPLLLRWPGMGRPVVNTDMVSSLDIMPTVLELLGVKAPEGLDGRPLLPLLRGEKQPDRDHVFTHVNTVSSGKSFPGRCVRTQTRAYIWNAWPDGQTQYRVEAMSGLSWAAMVKAAETDPKLKPRVQLFLYRTAEEFYDEERDPDERHNLINDPKYQAEIQRMKKLLLAQMERTGDPLLSQFDKTVRGVSARSENPLTRPSATLSPSDGERDRVRGASLIASVVRCIEPDKATGSSMAVVVDEGAPLVHTAQVFPINRRGKLVPATNVVRQANVVLENLDTVLKSAGSDLAQVVKLNIYLAQADAMPKVQRAIARIFSSEAKPAVSFVVGELAEPGALVAMDAVAVSSMESQEVKRFQSTDGAPLARPSDTLSPSDGERNGVRGIASMALLPAGPKLYVSGMADTNNLPLATRKTLEKLLAAIGHLGSQRDDIVQLKVFLQPMSEVAAVRKEIVGFFGGHTPPIVFVEWISPAPNPPVEIELIAAAKERDRSPVAAATNAASRGNFQAGQHVEPAAGGNRPRPESESVSFLTPAGTASTKVYSRVARVNHGNLIYVSGLYGLKSSDGVGQVREIFDSLGEVLKKTGSDFEHLVKATYYVTDNDASNKLNDLRPEFYNPQRPPAASKAKVKGVGIAGKTVTMDMIAVTK